MHLRSQQDTASKSSCCICAAIRVQLIDPAPMHLFQGVRVPVGVVLQLLIKFPSKNWRNSISGMIPPHAMVKRIPARTWQLCTHGWPTVQINIYMYVLPYAIPFRFESPKRISRGIPISLGMRASRKTLKCFLVRGRKRISCNYSTINAGWIIRNVPRN